MEQIEQRNRNSIPLPLIADPDLLAGLGRLVRLVKLLRLLRRRGPTQVRDLFNLIFRIIFVCVSSIIHCSDTDCALRVLRKHAEEGEKREEFAILSVVQVKNKYDRNFFVFLCNFVSIYQIITAFSVINQDAYAFYSLEINLFSLIARIFAAVGN